MRLDDISGIEVIALPLGYSTALIIESLVLIYIARNKLFINVPILVGTTARGLLAALAAGFCAYTTLNFYAVTSPLVDTLLSTFFQGFFATIVGAIGAGIVYYLLRSPELSEAYRSIHSRLWKTTTVGPQDEDSLAI